MIRIEPRAATPVWLAVLVPPLAAAAALLLAAVPLALAGAPVLDAYRLMAEGVVGSRLALAETLVRATPLVLTGLAAAVAFRARLYNFGIEGQVYLGGLGAVLVGAGAVAGPPALMIPLVALAGALGGAAGMLGPAWLRARLGVDEMVTTLLLNVVILLLIQMLLEGPLRDPAGLGWPQSAPIRDAAAWPPLVPGLRLHLGLALGVGLAILLQVVLATTVWGFAMRAVGDNATAARHAGLPVSGTLVGAGILSGALAGLAGAGEVAGLTGKLTTDLSPGLGFAGIVVAVLAGLSPLAVVVAAVFVAAVFVGADSMSRALSVSTHLADLIVALSLIGVLLGGFATRFKVVRR